MVGDDDRERRELIDDMTQLLGDIMRVFMPEVKKPTLVVPCPLCPILHITLSEVSTGDTIFCPQSCDAPLPSGYYGDLTISKLDDPIPTIGEGNKDNTLVIARCNCYMYVVSAKMMLKVFTNHYYKLQNILPINNLAGRFVSEQLIDFDEEQIIQHTIPHTKAASVVLGKIGNSLKARQTKSFDTLLTIMRHHGGLSCKELADQMRKELAENTNGILIIA